MKWPSERDKHQQHQQQQDTTRSASMGDEDTTERSDFQFGNKDEDYGDGDIVEYDSEEGADSEAEYDGDDGVEVDAEVDATDEDDSAAAQTVGLINDVEICCLLGHITPHRKQNDDNAKEAAFAALGAQQW